MNTSEAANKPSDIEAQFRGAIRSGDGYQYWTTSIEDEESVSVRDRLDGAADEPEAEQKLARTPLLAPGTGRRTLIRLASMVLVVVILGLAYFAFNYVVVSNAAGTDETQTADAIIVLGAAQYNGAPSRVLQERLDHAFNLYSDGTAPVIITTGAGAEGDITTEGLVGFEHLRQKGVPEADIQLIPEGTNTWEQLSAAAFQIERLELGSVLLVSDRYHNYRLLDIADELGIDAFVSPSQIEPHISDYLRETAAVSIGRITGYRRLSAFTSD